MSFEEYVREELKKEFEKYRDRRMGELIDEELMGDTHINSGTEQ